MNKEGITNRELERLAWIFIVIIAFSIGGLLQHGRNASDEALIYERYMECYHYGGNYSMLDAERIKPAGIRNLSKLPIYDCERIG